MSWVDVLLVDLLLVGLGVGVLVLAGWLGRKGLW